MSKNDKTIQEKMNQLSELVAWFESDEFELEMAIEKYKTAETLAGDIERLITAEVTDVKER